MVSKFLPHDLRAHSMVVLNHDIIIELLESLWILHTTEWTTEFRQEAFRRDFGHYALISKDWTLPSEVYVFKSVVIEWETRWQSLKSGLLGPRGEALRNSIRVLDVNISHSRLGIPVERLDSIVQLCSKLVELRLRVGPEVNTLYLKASQTARLRLAFSAVSPTLRALQVSFDGRRRKSLVMKQIPELIPFDQLDFIAIISHRDLPHMPTFDPDKWDVRIRDGMRYYIENWPLETIAATIPLGLVESLGHGASIPPLVVPTTFRIYLFQEIESYPFLPLLGPYLKQVVLQTGFRSVRWTNECDQVIAACPNLEKLLILDCYLAGSGCRASPVAEMYVLEPQDWNVPNRQTDDTLAEELFLDGSLSETRRLHIGEPIQTASHLVCFAWKRGILHDRPVYRKPIVYCPKWPSEAFLGIEENRDVDVLACGGVWSIYWTNNKGLKNHTVLIALRQPSTRPPQS